MSYEIVKSIKIDKKTKEVWLRSSSNNVNPKIYKKWLSKTLTKIYQKYGEKEVKKEILFQYFQGNFKKSNNAYEKSFILLDVIKYNWKTVGTGKKHSEEELKEVLYKNYLIYEKREKGNFVIQYMGNKTYISRFAQYGICTVSNLILAKSFKSKEEALYQLQKLVNFEDGKDEFKILKII